ncbi:2-oxo-4-hydroxy-4-carboxy-5-ureidoimidazoline decarboxylase [Aethina tumida]|uniref:2-oxo-4-hydroxy-4-carboxy-5-ureidoimidazoline decarboxylase n=1 Tax=Aethina tumida TaxID=116153 RepID=UPI00096AF17B|nr:2-oxo-4-hydroxy-4-carboxy-5-ureidoimidazoline decarboxylase [Aethina tumida]
MILSKLLSIDEVNGLISEHFIKIFGNVVQNSTATAIGILKYRPFGNVKDLQNAIEVYLDSLKTVDKEKILQDHPDMVSKLTDLSRLMLEYEVEIEGIYEVNRPSVAEKMHLKELNRKYIKKFGFPFISFGKENFFDVFTDIEKRIDNNKEEEILTAIKEIKKICRLRVLEIVQ